MQLASFWRGANPRLVVTERTKLGCDRAVTTTHIRDPKVVFLGRTVRIAGSSVYDEGVPLAAAGRRNYSLLPRLSSLGFSS